MSVTREQLRSYAAAFMREVAKVSFSEAEAWLTDREEHFLDIPQEVIPDNVVCSVIALQEFTDRGKREIELRCGCYTGNTQAIGYVYLAEKGASEVDLDIRLEDVS